MSDQKLSFDPAAAHRFFSADCFNRAWTYIEKADRTPEDDQGMLLLASASLWHWTQRADCTDLNLSIGHWQMSRVLSLLHRGEEAMKHAIQSLKYAKNAKPFFKASAHEAAARAGKLMNDQARFREHLHAAKTLAGAVEDAQEASMLKNDLGILETSV